VDWIYGQPPILIAANRWGFAHHIPGEFSDLVALQKYYEVLKHYPALLEPPPARTTPKRGRPREQKSPRLLLDAILWKLSTGRTWEELPTEFPSPRKCAKYYRRLFLSGRLYTLLYALHQHLRLEALVDTSLLVEQGVFTTTPSQHIALSPGLPATWQNYTALLFMQLARDAFMYSQREKRQRQRRYSLIPLLKGEDALSTGRWDAQPTPPPPPIQPLEKSPAAKKLQAIEKNRAAQERELRKRLRTLAKYFPASPNQPELEETEP
jgi:transposase